MSGPSGRGSAQRPVMMMAPGGLADEVTRLAAAAGCDLHRVSGPGTAREWWNRAPLVLLDADAAAASVNAGLPRRDGVVVVCADGDPLVWRCAVAVGAQRVVVLPDEEAWLVGALADVLESSADPGRVLAVLGGRGGAGASVLASAIAVAVVESGRQAMLVDCDALGGGLDLALGAEKIDGLRWSGLSLGGGRVPAAALRAALPTPRMGGRGGLRVVSCERPEPGRDAPGPDGAAVRAVCAAGRRAGETVICDVPRYPCEPGTAALESADLAVLVVPAEVRACAAAAAVAARVAGQGIELRLVVRGPAPGGITPGDVSAALRLPVLTAMRAQPGLGAALDRGTVPGRSRGPLASAARQVLAALDGIAAGRAA
ncbi:MAG TPA: septum site-determining protein Ssd [Pseudonocardiaceae bacterium]|nr:septum site-determining protein Ssd [Pseudonocardiaceae bacterium]